MSWLEAISLMAAAAAAGMVNAIAGGGTLITFPALLFFGTPPIVANATSTVALVVGTAGSIFGFRRHLEPVRPWLRTFIPVSLLGGGLGSCLLTRTSDAFFARIVPFLILFATILFFAQGAFRRLAGIDGGEQPPVRPHFTTAAVVFQFAVAVYGGYFGAGIGILMLASLGLLGLGDVHRMNALKNVLGSLINLVAAIWFIAHGLVQWPQALVMIGGALAGYYAGAHFSQRLSQSAVRYLICGTGLCISVVLLWRQFR
jgi:uncharacterized membrane protein YfcA